MGEKLQQKVRTLVVYTIGEKILRGIEKLIPHYSLIGDTPFFDVQNFSWAIGLEQNWQIIGQELDYILKYTHSLPNFQDISPDQAMNTSKDNLWKTYFLYGYGIKVQKNCQRCPQTTLMIEKIPGLKTAFFSILSFRQKKTPTSRGGMNFGQE